MRTHSLAGPLVASLLLAVWLTPSASWAQALTFQNVNPSPPPALGVPVGTILPYVGPLDALPTGWQPCDGRQVTDPASPFRGQRLPNLMSNRFLMGVAADQDVNREGGSNRIARDGEHTHTYSGRTERSGGVARRGGGNRDLPEDSHTHQYSGQTNAAGQHDHGGDNRPAYSGVYFIIRVR